MMPVVSTLDFGSYLEKLNSAPPNSILHIYDAFNAEMVESYLKKITPKYIVGDHYTSIDIGHWVYTVPLFAEYQEKKFKILEPLSFETTHCFNFMVNKPQVNRFLCLKLIEWFGLTDFDYTWSAIDVNFAMGHVIAEWQTIHPEEIPEDCRSFLLGAVTTPRKTLFESEQIVGEHLKTPMGVGEGKSNNWYSGLDKIFCGSAVSLITESLGHQRGAVFTEKTLCSVIGHTLPIWVGGYRQASEWKRVGFDIFEDVVDHSYQNYDTLIQRCYHAVADNLELLQNKKQTVEIRKQLMPRLQRNYELLQNNQIRKFVDAEIAAWPADLQQSMSQILYRFRQ